MLVERVQELGLLANLGAGVESSGGKVALIRAEASIGKSVLVAEFVARPGLGRHRPPGAGW